VANNVEITVTANNKASPVFKKIEGDANGLTKSLKSLGPALAGVFAGIGLVSGIKSFVGAAAEAEKAQAQLNAVLRSTKGAAGISVEALNSMAQAFQKTTTFSDEAVNGVQSLLLTFTNIKANIFEETTQAVLDMSTALGQDLKSSSIQLGKALQDPIAGVTALRRVGVMLTDDQEKLIKKLVETGNVLDAQKIILKEITTEFGGSASAAANTFAGKLAILNNRFDEMKETVGKAIINALLPALEDLGRWFDEHQEDIEDFAVSAVEAIRDLAHDFGKGLKIIADGLEYIPNNQGRIIGAVAAIGAAMAIAFGPASLAAVGIAAIIVALGKVTSGSIGADALARFKELQGFAAGGGGSRSGGLMGSDFGPGAQFGPGTPFPLPGPNFSEVTEFNAKLKETGYSFDAVKEKAVKLVDAFKEAGDTLRGALSKVDTAINGLFGRDTREQLDLKRKIEEAKGLGKGVHFGTEFGRPGTSEQFVARLQKQYDTLDAQHEKSKLRLQGLDQTILSEAELKKKTDELAAIIPGYTGNIKKSSDALGISLIPGFDDLTRASSDVIAAFNGKNSITTAAYAAVEALRKLENPNAEPLGNIPGRALGGLVAAGQKYIVGEQGPELFVPSSTGQIIPHAGLRGMARAKSASGGESMAVTIRGDVIVNNHGDSQDADGAIKALGYMIRTQARSRGAALAV